MTALAVGLWAGFILAFAPAGLLPSPTPPSQVNALPSPPPLPSLPPILQPTPSPSPTPAGTGATGHGSSHGGASGSQSTSSGFGPSGIIGAFGGTTASASTATTPTAASPAPYQPVAPPPSLFSPGYLFPNDRGAATQSAVLPLLGGLLLLSLGLWLMAMRHRREALQAASLERTKTDFLNLASHELRGPLTVLKGYVSTAREGHFGQLPKELSGRLPILQTQLARMEMLVEQMLETARLDAGHPEVRRLPTDLRRIVQNALPTEVLQDSEHKVEVNVPIEPLIVDIDDKRIEQVLHNLIDNALKYSPPPARVDVTVSSDDAGNALVAVRDKGYGIAPEDMGKLFSRFGRVLTQDNRHVPGVGLGLYLGRSVARMHGGELDAISEPGLGSTFTLTLPLHREGEAPVPVAEPPGRRALRWFGRLLPSRARESTS